MKRYGPLVPLFMLFSFAILGIVAGNACSPKDAPTPSPAPNPAATPAPVTMMLTNGVVYFEVTGDEYLKALQAFYEENPTLHCDYQGAVETVVNQGSQSQSGHILHCHDIAIPAQDVTIP